MKRQSWFQKEPGAALANRRPERPGPSGALDRAGLAAKLRPHELIAMLTHHYARVRARSLPRVTTTISVAAPDGRQAVTIGWG